MGDDAFAPTERETEILKVLWEIGEGSVREVHARMPAEENLAQNTVQTFLRIMEDKGLVAHRAEGRSFIYRPLYTREKTVSRLLHRVYDGAVDRLVMNALQAKKPTEEELTAIEKMIREARKRR